jgi:hypothetical protein
MKKRNFVVTVKERQRDEPCFLVFELHEDIGIGSKSFTLNMPDGTDYEYARELARTLNDKVATVRLID